MRKTSELRVVQKVNAVAALLEQFGSHSYLPKELRPDALRQLAMKLVSLMDDTARARDAYGNVVRDKDRAFAAVGPRLTRVIAGVLMQFGEGSREYHSVGGRRRFGGKPGRKRRRASGAAVHATQVGNASEPSTSTRVAVPVEQGHAREASRGGAKGA